MTKAYSYLRFSSAAQRDGDSLRRQLKAAHEWAEARPHIELDTSLRDEGVSAYRGEHRVKGALSSFLTRIQRGQIAKGSYFLVESFDRLSRENETVAINLLTSITLAGVRVVTLTDGAEYDDKSDAMDLMRAIIVMSRAHDENKARSKKLAAAWSDKKRRARENGEILSRRGPAWTRFDDKTGKFVLIPERAKVVRRIFADYLNGLGASTIAATLNAEGVKPFMATSNGFHTGYIMTILQSRSVMGFYQPHFVTKETGRRAVRVDDGEDIAGYYPAIIPPEDFYRVQAIRQKNTRGGGRRGRTYANTMMGLARCEDCGGTLVVTRRQNKTKSRVYICYDRIRKKGCSNAHRYDVDDIEAYLEFAITLAKGREHSGQADQIRLHQVNAEIADLKHRIELLLDQIEAGGASAAARLKKRNAELIQLEKEAKSLKVETGVPSAAMIEAIGWMRDIRGGNLTDAELYQARAKINAILHELYDWIVPTRHKHGGVFVGSGQDVRWIGHFEGEEVTAFGTAHQPITKPTAKVLYDLIRMD